MNTMVIQPGPRTSRARGLKVLLALLVAGACGFVASDAPADLPAPAAELHVTTEPADATILLDGETCGTSPQHVPVARPGRHLLAVSKRGYRDTRQSLAIGIGQKQAIDIKLEPLLGLALVQSTPAGAEVKIDNVDRGKTPLLVTDLPLGRYSFYVRAVQTATV